MLQIFRGAGSRWLVFGLLALVLIAVVVTGFGSGGSGIGDLGGGPQRLATVGDQAVNEQDFVRRLNSELSNLQNERSDLDMPGFIRLGGFEAILEQVIAEKAQISFAEDQKIGVSKRLVDGEIATIPAFQNAAGQFDEAALAAALGRLNLSPADLRESITVGLLRRQMLMPVVQGAKVPGNMMDYYARLLLETRIGSVAAVSNQAVGPGNQPTDAEVMAYFKSNPRRYTIPERRVVRYAMFGWTDVVGTVSATDAEIEAAYRQAGAQYGPKESRSISQLTLLDQAAANSFAAKVKAGTSFDAAARDAGFAPQDVVRFEGSSEEATGKLAPPVVSPAFAGALGTVIGPVRSPLGWHVGRVDKVTSIPGRPLAAVRNEIASTIQQRKAAEKLDSLVTKIEDDIANGKTFDEVVAENKLQIVETPPVTQAGNAPGTNYQLPAEAKALVASAFDLSTDDDPQVETIAQGQRYAMVAVRQIVEPTLPPFAQVQARVRSDLIGERSSKRAKELTDQIVAKVNNGTPMREALAGAGVPLPPAQPVRMRRADAQRAGSQLPPPVQMLFQLPRGKARAMVMPDGQGWFIVHAERVLAGDAKEVPALAQQLRPGFNEGLGNEYAEQLARAIAGHVGVKRNESAIAALRQRLLTGNRSQ